MNKTLKGILLAIMVIFSFTLFGCQAQEPQPGDTYTITYEDYDGTVLKTVSCTVGQTCDVTPPANPNNKDNAYFTRWSVWPDQMSSINKDTVIKAIYTLDNRALTIGGRAILFYSVFIMTGIIVGLVLGLREVQRVGLKKDDLIDGFLWIVPVSILGARIWYVISAHASFWYGGFWPSFLRTIGFESGTLDFSRFGLAGLAIHGAFITAVICAFFFTRKRKIDIFKMLDVVAVGFIIAQAFGRWGNFFNQEAHGGLVGGAYYGTDSQWHAYLSLEQQYNYLKYTLHLPKFIVNNMYIIQNLHILNDGRVHLLNGVPVNTTEILTGYYHPTFFYESTINLIGFGIMLILRRIKKVHFGEIFAFYLIWYGALRIFIETMRTDPLEFNFFGITLKTAIVTSAVMILLGIAFSVYIRKTRKGKDYSTVPGYFGYKKDQALLATEGSGEIAE